MKKIDPAAYQQRLERLSEILNGIASHAGEVLACRCPYKDKHNRCTAQFGCRNQRRAAGKVLICEGDDKLEYRSAWETKE
jgi:uncharacterized protein